MDDNDFLAAMRIEPCSIPEPIPSDWRKFDERVASDNARREYEAHIQALQSLVRQERIAHDARVIAILDDYVSETREHRLTVLAWKVSAIVGWIALFWLLSWLYRTPR